MPDRYQGECECPTCGCGSKDLKLDALPFLVKRLGKWAKLSCDICGQQYIVNVEEANE